MQKTRIHSSRFRRFLRSLYTYKGLLLMMLPAIVFFAVFRYAPMPRIFLFMMTTAE